MNRVQEKYVKKTQKNPKNIWGGYSKEYVEYLEEQIEHINTQLYMSMQDRD